MKSSELSDEKPLGGKIGKRRVTVLFAASMRGEKFRSVIISSLQYPTAVMQYEIRIYDYYVQDHQWMHPSTFEHILEMWNTRLKHKRRHIASIVDVATVHRTEKPYSNITLYFLPPGQTAIMQPMDQGIIRSFKSIYRSFRHRSSIHFPYSFHLLLTISMFLESRPSLFILDIDFK